MTLRGTGPVLALALTLWGACRPAATPGAAATAPPGAAPPAGPRGVAGRPDARGRMPSPMNLLDDDFERIFPDRVRLARRGAVRFRANDAQPANDVDRPGADIEPVDAPSLVLVDEDGPRMRVVAQEGSYRLLLWIDARDLRDVAAGAIDLAPARDEPAPAPPGPGVTLRPGAVVAIEEEAGSRARVRHVDPCLTARGWVPRASIARRFTPADGAEGPPRNATAGARIEVLDRPGGRTLVRFDSDCDVAAREDPAAPAGATSILYAGPWVEVRGWLAAPSATAGGGGRPPSGYAGLFGRLGIESERFDVPAGACLYARRGGDLVGVTTEDGTGSGAERDGGGWRFEAPTAWGNLPVWVAEVPPAPGARAAGGAAAREGDVDTGAEEEALAERWGLRAVAHGPLRACR